jgi:hypothetical protein
VPPPPPPRVPWELALERLDEVRHAGLLETNRFSDFFDRVNDAVREYLGARFGFDGLESTTDEILVALRPHPAFLRYRFRSSQAFLQQCDLVKFADLDAGPRGVSAHAAPSRAHRARDHAAGRDLSPAPMEAARMRGCRRAGRVGASSPGHDRDVSCSRRSWPG